MPVFAWEGRTRSGDVKKGTIEADSEAMALARLKADQIAPTKVKLQGKGLLAKLPGSGGVKEKDLVIFTRQFATMIDAGLPLVQCLDILSNQTENKKFGKILGDVKTSVEGGATFSDSLKKHPKAFDDLYCNLIAAGEVGGILDTILGRLGTYIEKAAKLKQQVKGAMTYPIAVLGIAIIVVVVILTKVIPVFQNMFKEFKGGALPAPTQFVINLSESFKRLWYVWIISAATIGFGLPAALKTEKGRETFDSFILKVPIIGTVLRKVVVARFTRTMGTLLSSGVPILDALEIVAKTAGNVVVKKAIMYAREKISEGKDLAGPLAETKVFPPMVVQMIGVGEQTGAMDTMLQKIADFYEDEVDVAVEALTSLLEPIMMVFLGGIVGGLIIAMYLPIFELAGNIKAE
ncbi:MAG: type II secretion system F family protein [Deltaproteobacteria bacterium]|nr:type II secretion system F family protein [Deltaproteobacteria bacterium]